MKFENFVKELKEVETPQEVMVSGYLSKIGFPLITVNRAALGGGGDNEKKVKGNAKKVKMVNEVNLSFPVDEEKFQSVAEFATQAQFGKGDHTLTDEKVRKTLEIQPAQVVFRNAGDWNALVGDCVTKIAAKNVSCDGGEGGVL